MSVNYIFGERIGVGGSSDVEITKAELDALIASGEVNPNISYYVKDWTQSGGSGIASNPNLLINSDFRNPVNQRGVTASTWTKSTYGIDRWKIEGAEASCTSLDGGVSIIGKSGDYKSSLMQNIELIDITLNTSYTVSVCVDGVVKVGTGQFKSNETVEFYRDDKILIASYTGTFASLFLCNLDNGVSHKFKWVKLEEGSIATPFRPRLYAEELQLCKRYFQALEDQYFALDAVTSNNNISLVSQFEMNGMRCLPTVTNKGTTTLYVNGGTSQTGFTFSFYLYSRGGINLTATKTSHGLTYANYPRVSASLLWLDAEL